ncbi:MAG: hypothetical protein JWN53_410 [Gemmatimonadetes bacterium]|jgi:hypothetical protein|nr:hypothetical protein [Gemmatimonadota bacterium]
MWTIAALGVLVTMAACYSQNQPDPNAEPVPPAILKVENQAFLDMTIYLLRGPQRIRMGIATGNSTTRFTIPPNVLFGATPLAFFADPIGGHRTPVSEEITVSPGDEVTLTIPPR